MKTSVGLLFLALYTIIGLLSGALYRRYNHWQRAGIYVKGDEGRIGMYVLYLVTILSILHLVESMNVYHQGIREGWWLFSWCVAFIWGHTAGYVHVPLPKSSATIEIERPVVDTTFAPITSLVDEEPPE